MYSEIIDKYKLMFPNFPDHRRPLVGSVIREMRIDKGISQHEFAKKSGINISTLKSIENDHQEATSVDNLENISNQLHVSTEDLILDGREWDPANYFVFKTSKPPKIDGIRIRKKAPEAWHQSVRIQYPDFKIIPISPPITTNKDFLLWKLFLHPLKKIDLKLPCHEPVLGFLSSGYKLQLQYANRSYNIDDRQGFSLDDGFYPHTLVNQDESHTAVIYLFTRLLFSPISGKIRALKMTQKQPIDIARGLEALQKAYAHRHRIDISVQDLADASNLKHEQITEMMRLQKGSSIISWAKIEAILGGTNHSMEDFLNWAQNYKKLEVHIAASNTRPKIEYPNYGIKIIGATPPGFGNRFFCGELFIKANAERMDWTRKDNCMIGIDVQIGELEVNAGRKRSTMPLELGNSIYFNGNLSPGYQTSNPGEKETKAFFVSYPGIQL